MTATVTDLGPFDFPATLRDFIIPTYRWKTGCGRGQGRRPGHSRGATAPQLIQDDRRRAQPSLLRLSVQVRNVVMALSLSPGVCSGLGNGYSSASLASLFHFHQFLFSHKEHNQEVETGRSIFTEANATVLGERTTGANLNAYESRVAITWIWKTKV